MANESDSNKPAPRRKRSTWRHLQLLMWKNLLLRRRHWILTILEILLPTALFSVILFIRLIPGSVFIPTHVNTTTVCTALTERDLKELLCFRYGIWFHGACHVHQSENPGLRLYYGPPGNFTQRVARHVAEELNLPLWAGVPVSSNEEMDSLVEQAYFTTNDSLWNFFIGLYFEEGEVPRDLKYDLRMSGIWMTASLYPFVQTAGPGECMDRYINGGFVLVQSLVDRFYISQLPNNQIDVDAYEVQVQGYPYPPYFNDHGVSLLYGSFLPSYVVLSFVLLSPSLIKSVVHEKETGVRELVQLMGMKRWLAWLGWFLHSLMPVLAVVTIITIMITVGLHNKYMAIPPILNYSDPFFVWVLLALYGISSIAFCLTVSTFFSRPTLATTLGILIWFLSYNIPNSLIYFKYDKLGLAPKILSCLFPNMAMSLAFRVIEMFEGRALGVQWNNLWSTGNPRDELTPAMIMLMLVLDTFIYFFLIWYVDQVSPGAYGVPQPWYFPFQKTYWCGSGPLDSSEDTLERDLDPGTQQYFEEEPAGLKPGIVIRNLRKEFKSLGGKVKVAVENVSMTCYEGQCTVLLGHNGAGKTTTMSVLTGVYAPSGGYAKVGDWNITTNLSEAREEMGLCPQHNMLFVDLTVLQHLLFFGRLKGVTTSEAKEEALEVLKRLDLLDKKDMFGNQLSGGMKRKLSLAISLVGGSKVVILDEPSSGLDPESRRWVWDVVQGERGRRTFLVTTHHMEEADVLGDRVAIMASGRVVCAGSTLFLKDKFGDGYTLQMIATENGNVDAMESEVKRHMPSASLLSCHSGEVTFKLPPDTSRFATLLEALNQRREDLGVRHIGLSLTTMERVFLGVSDVLEKNVDGTSEVTKGDLKNGKEGVVVNGLSDLNLENGLESSQQHLCVDPADGQKMHGQDLLSHQIQAFFIKRAIYTKRKWPLFLTQGLVPVVVTLLCLFVDHTLDLLMSQEPPLDLDISLFPYSYSSVYSDPALRGLAEQYESLFQTPHEVSEVANMTSSLLAAADEDLFIYRENHICSAEFLDNESNAVVNILAQTIPYHTMGIGTNLASNALLRLATHSTDHTISTTNNPLPADTMWKFVTEFTPSSLIYAEMMPLALAFLSASFLVFPLQERETKAKQLQLMTGAPAWALWMTTFFWDFAAYLVSALLIFVTFMAVDPNGYFTSNEAPGALILLLVLYGWGSIPMAYVFSYFFQTAASGFAILTVVNLVAGELILAVVFGMRLAEQDNITFISDIIHWITSLIPAYPVAMGFGHLVEISSHNVKCNHFNESVTVSMCAAMAVQGMNNDFMQCCRVGQPPLCTIFGDKCFEEWSYFRFDRPGLAPDLLSLFANGVIFMLVIAFIEMDGAKLLLRLWHTMTCREIPCVKVMQLNGVQVGDEDVTAEAELVRSMMAGETSPQDNMMMTDSSYGLLDTTLLVSNLSKRYSGLIIPAVNDVSFRVGRGECLGLLGVNGAGKTTTFKMLTGDEEPSAGDARIGGFSLNTQRRKFVRHIGYCPQFDAILEELTGVEMLQLMGRLRGVRGAQLRKDVSTLVSLVDLTECAERPSSTYSGGNRRKLSTAMALVGSPPLVFLDEPTSGVDPVSRRRVWTAINQAIRNGQSVVLTSHSMEECEALCSRIVIMSRGTLRCVGTTGHLKAKFGQGYSLQVKLKTHGFKKGDEAVDDVYDIKKTELMSVISQYLPGATLIDQHKGMLAYRIPSSVSWDQLFSVMEDLKAGRYPGRAATAVDETSVDPSIVEVYAASDTSLEQVFLSFAREEEREEESLSAPGSPTVSGVAFDPEVLRAPKSVTQGPSPSGVSGTAMDPSGVDGSPSGDEPFQPEFADWSVKNTNL